MRLRVFVLHGLRNPCSKSPVSDGVLSCRPPRAHQALADHRHHRARHRAEGGRAATSSASSAGEPDFDTPENIQEAAIAAIQRGETRYTAFDGTLDAEAGDLRQVQARERARLQARPDHRRHRRQAGALQRAGRDAEPRRRGDHPGALLGLLSRHGAAAPTASRCSVACPQNNGFKMRPEDLDAAITPKTKWLILNSPSNPTGAAYTRGRSARARRRAAEAPACLGHDRRHVRAPRLRRFRVRDDRPGRAAALRAHADRQRRLQGLLHDRLAHRLCRRPGAR